MNQVYDHIWKHLTIYFLICFFCIFSDEFYWIFYQGPPTVIFQRYKNVNLILAPRIFYFRNLISFFQLFQNLQEVSIFRNLFIRFYALMPSSIFLSQSIRTFPPSVPLMPCSFPFFLFHAFLSYSASLFLFAFPQCFLIQSSSFIPSLSVFCCSFPVKFPSFFWADFLKRHISHLQAHIEPWNDWRHNSLPCISWRLPESSYGLIWALCLISSRWALQDIGKLSESSSSQFPSFMPHSFSCFLHLLIPSFKWLQAGRSEWIARKYRKIEARSDIYFPFSVLKQITACS